MADLENAKIVDVEKQQPLLASSPDQLQSGPVKRTVSNADKFTRVVLVLLLILNFAQWRYSVTGHDKSSTVDEDLEKENAVLKLQHQVRGFCLERVAFLESVEAGNQLASLPRNSGNEALQALEDFLSTTTIESEDISVALKMVEKVLAQQNERLYDRGTTQQTASHPRPDLQSACEVIAF